MSEVVTEEYSVSEVAVPCDWFIKCENPADWIVFYSKCNKCGNQDTILFCDIHLKMLLKSTEYEEVYCECEATVKIIKIESV